MSFFETLQGAFSGVQTFAQQAIIAPVSERVTSAYSAATQLLSGQQSQQQVQQQQATVQAQYASQQAVAAQQAQQQQIQQQEQPPTPTYSPSTPSPFQAREYYAKPPPSPPIIQPPKTTSALSFTTQIPQYVNKPPVELPSILKDITAGMKPISPNQDFGGRMNIFLGNVGQGVKNIYESGAQVGFKAIESQNLQPIMPAFQGISEAGRGLRESETGKWVREQFGYKPGQEMTQEQFKGGIKNIEKTGMGLAFAVPQSVSENMLAPGVILGHGATGKLSGEDVTRSASFGLGLLLPAGMQGSGMALKGVGQGIASKLGASALTMGKVGYIAEKLPTAGGWILGGLYAKDVAGRMSAGVETGEFKSRPSTSREIADYKAKHPTEAFTGIEDWTTPVPETRKATDLELYRRGTNILSTEIIPMSFGAMLSPKFANVRLPTKEGIEIAKLAGEGKIVEGKVVKEPIDVFKTTESDITKFNEENIRMENLLKLPQSQTAWGGLTTPEGSPIFGKTPEGFKFGTPTLKEATTKGVYKPVLTSEEGYLPVGKTELELAQKNVISQYTPEVQSLIGKQLELRGITFGQKSAFIKPELQIKEITEKGHGLKPETTRNIIKYLKKQSDIKVEGSAGQSAQMKVSRGMHDLDIQVKDKLKVTEELLKIIEKTEKPGKVVRKSETTAGLSTKKGGTLFDIHDINVSPEQAIYGSSQAVGGMLKFGFKAEPTIDIGGIKTQALSEQATAKMGSTIMLRKPLKWGGTDLQKLTTLPEVSPDFHRAKDIVDIFKIEDTLIASKKTGMFAFLEQGKIKKAESLSKDIESAWTGRVQKYDVEYTSRDLGGKKTTMKSDFEKTMKKYAEGTQQKETIDFSPKETKSTIEMLKDYTSKASKGVAKSSPKTLTDEYKSKSKTSKLSKSSFSQPSRISGYEMMNLDISSSKPSGKSKTSKPSNLLSLSIPPSKPYSSKSKPSEPSKTSKPYYPSTPPTPQPSKTSKPSEPYSQPPYSTPSYPKPYEPYIPKVIPPPLIIGMGGSLPGGASGLFSGFGKQLKIHKIPSPAELMGFGETKSKGKGKSILELDI